MTKEQKIELDKLSTYLNYAKTDNLEEVIVSTKTIETVLNILKEKIAEVEIHTGLEHFYKKEDLDKLELLREANVKIKEKDEEIEKLKVENENVWKLNANMSQRHLSDIFRIKKKDKQIDLMADFIDKTGAGRRAFSCTFRKNDECNENGCRYCIKQYFKEIAERKNEE